MASRWLVLALVLSGAFPLRASTLGVTESFAAKQQEIAQLTDQLAAHRRTLEDLSHRAFARWQDLATQRQEFLARRQGALSDSNKEYEALRVTLADLAKRMAESTYAEDQARLFLQYQGTNRERAAVKDRALADLARLDDAERTQEEDLAHDLAARVKELEAERLATLQCARDLESAQAALTVLQAEATR